MGYAAFKVTTSWAYYYFSSLQVPGMAQPGGHVRQFGGTSASVAPLASYSTIAVKPSVESGCKVFVEFIAVFMFRVF